MAEVLRPSLCADSQRQTVDRRQLEEDLDDLGVELRARIGGYLVDGHIYRKGRLVRPHRGHCVKRIGDQDYAGEDRNRVAGKSEWVAPAVEAFVMIENRLGHFGIKPIACHGESKLGVTLHQLLFGLAQWTGFTEDGGIHVDLANIVEHTGQCQPLQFFLAKPDTATQVNRQVGYPMYVPMQIFDDVFHHLDQQIVWELSHTNTTGDILLGTSALVHKSIVPYSQRVVERAQSGQGHASVSIKGRLVRKN